MTEHAKKFGAEIVTDTVERIGRDADGWFDVHTARGNVYRSQAVILTAAAHRSSSACRARRSLPAKACRTARL